MASSASEIDSAVEPHVIVEEPSSAGGGEGEAPPEAEAAEVVVEREAGKGKAKEEEAEEEEVGECEFCLYMKAGSCKETFVSWEQCMQAAENEGSNIVERCSEATVNLMKCMEAHADYYGPVFRAEQHVSDQAEAAIAAAAADTDKNKGEESAPSPASDETKKEEAVAESPADGKGEVVEQSASSTAAEEAEKAVVEKIESLSLGN